MTPEKFASKTVRAPNGCLIWTGAKTGNGYGQFQKDGHKHYIHRWVWEQENGPIPDGAEILHSCDNPPCAEITHLEADTHRKNMEEASERGLLVREKCPQGHLYTPENKSPSGHCRICRREQNRAYRARMRSTTTTVRKRMKEKNDFESTVVLGRKYRDEITGIEGVAVVVSFHLHACEQVSLEYPKDQKSAFHTVDVGRLIDVDSEEALEAKGEDKTGSTARPVASRHREI